MGVGLRSVERYLVEGAKSVRITNGEAYGLFHPLGFAVQKIFISAVSNESECFSSVSLQTHTEPEPIQLSWLPLVAFLSNLIRFRQVQVRGGYQSRLVQRYRRSAFQESKMNRVFRFA